MKISTRARYGTRLMVELGRRYGQGPVFLKKIARTEDISEKYLSQIIIPLKAAGLVNSFRGARGGYALAKEPGNINIREIVEVLEGDFTLVECVKNENDCLRSSVCVTRNLWNEVGKAIANTLAKSTLEDLVRQCKDRQDEVMMYNI